MNVAIVGTGYVGLVTGICFAETGNHVTCIDIDERKIAALRDGRTPIYEPGLELLLERNLRGGRIRFTTNLAEGIEGAQVIFLALPTPPGADGGADLHFVLDVAAELAGMITSYTVIVNKSTVPVGTADRVAAILSARLDRPLFDVVSNPEFLREGVAVDDFLKPDRVVVGTSSKRARNVMEELYAPFVRQGNPIHYVDERSAEMTKYAANAYLAMRISFMNEIANLCEKAGANVDAVRIGIGSDSRIGKRFLFPGVGYGGSCFPKDVKALAQTARELDYDFGLIQKVIEVNERQKAVLPKKVTEFFGADLSGRHFAVWGLSFKPETDDMRDAPSITIINALLEAGATIAAHDPEAEANAHNYFQDRITYTRREEEALAGADALLILTEWSVFRNPDFGRMAELMALPVIFDGRNVYSLEKMDTLPFYYESIGRRIVHPHLRETLIRMDPETVVRSRGL